MKHAAFLDGFILVLSHTHDKFYPKENCCQGILSQTRSDVRQQHTTSIKLIVKHLKADLRCKTLVEVGSFNILLSHFCPIKKKFRQR